MDHFIEQIKEMFAWINKKDKKKPETIHERLLAAFTSKELLKQLGYQAWEARAFELYITEKMDFEQIGNSMNIPKGQIKTSCHRIIGSLENMSKGVAKYGDPDNIYKWITRQVRGGVEQGIAGRLEEFKLDIEKSIYNKSSGLLKSIRSCIQDQIDTSLKQSGIFDAVTRINQNTGREKIDIERLQISTRIYNILKSKGYEYINELDGLLVTRLAKIKGIGATSIHCIDDALKEWGMGLTYPSEL